MVLINYPKLDLIESLKVIFQDRKGLNLPLFSNFDSYCPFIQNLLTNFFFMKLPQDGDNEL